MDSVYNIDFDKFKNISLEEVKVAFPKKAYNELISLGINNLGDLFEMEMNGTLIKIFFQKHKDAHELWSYIKGTTDIIKCKYLKIDPYIDINDKYKFSAKIGVTSSIRKRIYSFDSLQLPNLRKLIEDNNYGILYANFSDEVVEELIYKVKVLSEYYKDKEDVSLTDLKALYQKLNALVNEHQRIENEIDYVKSEIVRIENGGIKK